MTTSTNSPAGRVSWPRSVHPLNVARALLGRALGENRVPNANVTPLTRYAKALGTSSIRPLGRLETLRVPLYTGALVGGALVTVTQRRPHRNWRTAFFAGLVSGSFSTAIITLGAPIIGRSSAVDWMELAPVWLGDSTIKTKPTLPVMAAGIVVHASADVAWATLLFGVAGKRILRRSPLWLIVATPPWAVMTSMIEYFAILPWLQPVVTRQVPYWTALSVHLLSGAAYSQYPWVEHLAGARDVPQRQLRFATWSGWMLAGALLSMTGLYALQRMGKSPRWPMGGQRGRDFDRSFLYRMTGHHVAGLKLARLAVEKAHGAELCLLAKLEVAQQSADIDVMRAWWRGWFGGDIPELSDEDYAAMVGMPHPSAVDGLAELDGDAFERRFLELMIPHHHGAIIMANNAVAQAGDPRMRTLADSIRHAQQSQIERMQAQPNAPATTVSARHLYQATTPEPS